MVAERNGNTMTGDVTVHPAENRGATRTGWLDSRHSFSFGPWHDPDRLGIPPLRVLNHDRVDAGAGFDSHPHRDMEIVSYVLRGAMMHEDTTGHGGVIREGEVQLMRAGDGVVHSSGNASDEDLLELLQVWFEPRNDGLEPAYEKRKAEVRDGGTWSLLARDDHRNPHGYQARGKGLAMDADAAMLAARIPPEDVARYDLAGGRQAYLYVIEGTCHVNGVALKVEDAATVRGDEVVVEAEDACHVVLFDLPV